jgi:hypothetical protein
MRCALYKHYKHFFRDQNSLVITEKRKKFHHHFKIIIITIKIKSTKVTQQEASNLNAVTAEQIRGSNMRQEATV